MFAASESEADVSARLLQQLHAVLRPFVLRRLKTQVADDLPPKKETLLFVGMSELQAKLYRGVLERDIEAVLGHSHAHAARTHNKRAGEALTAPLATHCSLRMPAY